MASHPVAVAADVDEVAAVERPVEQRCGHDLVVQDLAPALEALVRGVLVAPVDQLEEKDGAAAGDREVADLVDDHELWVGERLEALIEASGGLGLLEGVDQVGQGAVVDLPAALGRSDGQADGQVGLADAGRTTFSFCSTKPSSWSESICSRLMEGWKLKSASVLIAGRRLERNSVCGSEASSG